MLNPDDVYYDIPSVPKFADLRRIGQGDLPNDANRTIGDAYFDVSGIIVGGMVPPAYPSDQQVVSKEQGLSEANKENEPGDNNRHDNNDDDAFGIKKLAMFRPPQRQRKAVSVERMGIAHVDKQCPVKQRAASVDAPKQRPVVPLANEGTKRPVAVRRSVPVALRPISRDRVRYPSGGDTRAQSHFDKDKKVTGMRVAQPMMDKAGNMTMQHRVQKTDLALCHEPETSAGGKLGKHAVSSVSNVNATKSKDARGGEETAMKGQQPNSGTAVRLAQTSAKKIWSSTTTVRATGNRGLAGNVNVHNKAEMVTAVSGGHVPRERTRRTIVSQKGPVRMQKIPIPSSKGLAELVPECRFREAVTHCMRGGESLERSNNKERRQAQQPMIRKELHVLQPPTHSARRSVQRPTLPFSGSTPRQPTKIEKQSQPRMAERARSLDRAGAAKTARTAMEPPRRRSSARLTEAEREALFARLSTPRNVVTKHDSGVAGTTSKMSTETVAKTVYKRRSGFPIPPHPSTRGLRAPIVCTRSNTGSQPSSRPESAAENVDMDQPPTSGAQPLRSPPGIGSTKVDYEENGGVQKIAIEHGL